MPKGFAARLAFAGSIFFLTSGILFWHHSGTHNLSPIKAIPSDETVYVGFDLTASYGTAAIRYPNGSFLDIAQVDGSSEYKDLIYRLSLEPSEHTARPYTNFPDELEDMPRQWLRRFRKAIGLPASKDVGILASLIFSLRRKVEAHLGYNIATAAVTTVPLVGLYGEDMKDAYEYLGLTNPYPSLPIFLETSAAYGGHGLGLCANYTDYATCWDERGSMPRVPVLAILYTRSVLAVALPMEYWVPIVSETPYPLDFSRGSDAPDGGDYWKIVADRIQEPPVRYRGFLRPEYVLLMGESALDETFLKVLKGALEELIERGVMENMPEILGENALFTAARGAAEFAMIAPYYDKPPPAMGRQELSFDL